MKVWERINQIRGENMTLEEVKEMCSDFCPICETDKYGRFEDSKLSELAQRFIDEEEFCTEYGAYCDDCQEAFLELDYPEEVTK